MEQKRIKLKNILIIFVIDGVELAHHFDINLCHINASYIPLWEGI